MTQAHDSLPAAIEAARLPSAGRELFVAVDIDGTLVHHNLSVSGRVVSAIRAHLEAGTNLILCTGRGVSGAQIAMQHLGIDTGYTVCSNGAVILAVGDTASALPTTELPAAVREETPDVRLISAHTFNPEKEIEVLAKALPHALLAVESLTDTRRLTAPFPEGELTGKSVVVPLSELSHPCASRLTVRAPEMTADELLDTVNKLGLNGVEYAIGWSAWMDVSPNEVTKATGLQDVLNLLHLPHRNTVAVGDSGNDCQMLQWAHLGVAMGNAPDYVAQCADTVTESVYEDGAALVLEALL